MRIVTSVSQDYLDLLRLWLDLSAPNMPVVPTVIAMDDTAFAAASADSRCRARLAPTKAADAPDRDLFWIRRLGLLLDEALAEDSLFIHSDLDAFWLADIATLLSDEPFDLAFSMDYGHPPEIGRSWGFTLCPGLFATRGGLRLAPFARRWMTETRRYSDDQNAVNYLMRDLGIIWHPYELKGQSAYVGEFEIEGQLFRVLVIPRAICDRLLPLEADRGLMVAHTFFDRRFRSAAVRLLSRFTGAAGLPESARPNLDEVTRVSLRRNLLLHAGYGAVDQHALTAAELHHYAVLETTHGEVANALALFDAALAAGAELAVVGVDSHLALHQASRVDDARAALATAIAAADNSRVLRRFAANARAMGAYDLAIKAVIGLVGLSFRDPGRVLRRLARAVRRYGPRRRLSR